MEEHTATQGTLAGGGKAGRPGVGGTSVASDAVMKRQYLCSSPGTTAAASGEEVGPLKEGRGLNMPTMPRLRHRAGSPEGARC